MSKEPVRTSNGNEPRNPEYVVRARTGSSRKDWSTVGVAWDRNGKEGFSVKLNSIPIGRDWDGVLKVLPVLENYDEEDQGDMPAEGKKQS